MWISRPEDGPQNDTPSEDEIEQTPAMLCAIPLSTNSMPPPDVELQLDNNGSVPQLLQIESLLDRYFDDVYRYAFHLCNHESSAEDIAQEVFLRATKAVHQLRDVGLAKAWLLAITRREYFRSCRSWRVLQLSDEIEISSREEPVDTYERCDWVQNAVQQLPELFRAIVLMFYVEQLSYTEIAVELDLPLGTVMSRLNRGRKHLKKLLQQSDSIDAAECDQRITKFNASISPEART